MLLTVVRPCYGVDASIHVVRVDGDLGCDFLIVFTGCQVVQNHGGTCRSEGFGSHFELEFKIKSTGVI
jgi:hypothetical protein